MSNIFDLFNLADEMEVQKQEEAKKVKEEKIRLAEEQKKAREEERKAASSTAKEVKPVKKQDEFAPNENTIIVFHSERIDIGQYFTNEELEYGLLVQKTDNSTERQPLTGELLRKRMEKDYPELIAGMTDVVYLKAKNMIVVIMVAKKKGATSAESVLLTNKIPYSILHEFVNMAYFFGNKGVEVHADIYFDHCTSSYFLDVPGQKVTWKSTEVIETPYSIAERVEVAQKICEIHSHHTMEAYFSTQDNLSERLPGMFYVVVGRTQDYFPMIKARKFTGDHIHENVEVSAMFTSPFSREIDVELTANVFIQAKVGVGLE